MEGAYLITFARTKCPLKITNIPLQFITSFFSPCMGNYQITSKNSAYDMWDPVSQFSA